MTVEDWTTIAHNNNVFCQTVNYKYCINNHIYTYFMFIALWVEKPVDTDFTLKMTTGAGQKYFTVTWSGVYFSLSKSSVTPEWEIVDKINVNTVINYSNYF